MRSSLLIAAGCLVLVVGCIAPPAPEATSLAGRSLHRPVMEPSRRAELQADLDAAQAAYAASPGSEDAVIWYGRRLAYLGRYRDAIGAFSRGLETHPESYKLLRHRGHRCITVRELDSAIADLARAAELARGVPDETEPDGAPNARGIPGSTSHSNIWYHLGLALYLKGDYARAAAAFDECLSYSRINDDMLVATSYWLFLSRKRSHGDAEGVLDLIRADMDVIENHDYHRLLLLWKGTMSEQDIRAAGGGGAVSDATIGYGLGVRKLLLGETAAARETFAEVVRGTKWAAFGYIAAEAELSR